MQDWGSCYTSHIAQLITVFLAPPWYEMFSFFTVAVLGSKCQSQHSSLQKHCQQSITNSPISQIINHWAILVLKGCDSDELIHTQLWMNNDVFISILFGRLIEFLQSFTNISSRKYDMWKYLRLFLAGQKALRA